MVVQEFVDSTISGNKVAIFSKSHCPYCANAKALFAKEFPGITPTVVELDQRADGSDIQDYLYKKTGQRSVPNIFVGSKHIGGNDDTQASFKVGKLAELLRA
ncbi:hypothetical protein K443DRAFT_681820 [Laccaria amethystina LaAM-08-1]|uniref:glutathione peroxidase n=1 Tax=Laccaria amethystina LaAM-08-1 TaxID=1095629 RepID=A0A0C9XHB1_9AGAR|nr:hypothetical protein K443DRAFT_681820 [Laccaria amethystina LaAM-08-1]